ncbi:MAG: HAD-IIIC family phosphatase, partial [Tissierellaceae bacterium]
MKDIVLFGASNYGKLVYSYMEDKEDVDELFSVNTNLYLSKDDFTIMKINWERKSKNITEIADELNIGLDSIVFIDDNPAEREQVKIELPDVTVPEFPSNIYNLNLFLEKIYNDYFFTISVT